MDEHHSRIMSSETSTHIVPALTTPPEILAAIFSASLESDDDSSEQVIACSQVCQFWRNVALSTPALWTRIDLQHPGSEEFAIRSQPSPIHIIVNESVEQVASSIDDSTLRHAAWLMTNISRVHGLILRASSTTIHKIISLFGPVAPNVLKVDIRLMHILSGSAFPSVVKFAPNVRWLALWMVDTDLNSYGNLTHISFHSLCPSRFHILPFAAVVLLLQRSPRLQTLHLINVHLDHEQGTGAARTVELAFMERMLLVDVVGVVYLLSSIFIPASAAILGHRRAEMRSLSSDDRKAFAIKCTGRTLRVNIYEMDDVYRHHRGLTFVDDSLISNDTQSIILAIASCLDLSRAQIGALIIDTLPDDSGTSSISPSVDIWQAILFTVPTIELLMFYHDSAGWTPNILLALSPSASNIHDKLPCPTLRTLNLGPNTSDIHPDSFTSPLNLARTTIQILSARADFGASPLWILKLNFGDDQTAIRLKWLVYILEFRVSVVLEPPFTPPAGFI
jgi:F-box-like